MSHVATKWAFDQPAAFADLKPAELCVLLALADCHNPAQGCYPSQEYIRKVTNISERSVREHLARLRERGLVNWEETRRDGHRANNRYILAFEDGFQPAESAGSPYRQELPEQPAESDAPTGNVLPVDTKEGTVTGTVREPLRESADAREAGEASDGREQNLPHAEMLERLRAKAPTTIGDDRLEVEARWRKLTPEQRRQAEALYDDWLTATKKLGRRMVTGLAVYLRDRLWEPLAARGHGTATSAAPFAPPWTRRWWWLTHDFVRRHAFGADGAAAQVLRGKFSLAKNRVGWKLPDGISADVLEERSAAELRQVPIDSAEARAFADAWRARGAPFETPDAVDWIFVPRAPPEEWLAAAMEKSGQAA